MERYETIPHTLTKAQLKALAQLGREHLRTIAGTSPKMLAILLEQGLVRTKDVYRYAITEYRSYADPRVVRIDESTVTSSSLHRDDPKHDLVPCVIMTTEGDTVEDTMRLIRTLRRTAEKLGHRDGGELRHIADRLTSRTFKLMLREEAA